MVSDGDGWDSWDGRLHSDLVMSERVTWRVLNTARPRQDRLLQLEEARWSEGATA